MKCPELSQENLEAVERQERTGVQGYRGFASEWGEHTLVASAIRLNSIAPKTTTSLRFSVVAFNDFDSGRTGVNSKPL